MLEERLARHSFERVALAVVAVQPIAAQSGLSHSSSRKLSQVDEASNTAALILGNRSKNPDIRTIVTHNAASAWKFCTLVRNNCRRPDDIMLNSINSAGECCSV